MELCNMFRECRCLVFLKAIERTWAGLPEVSTGWSRPAEAYSTAGTYHFNQSFHLKKVLVSPMQLVMDVPGLHHIGMCTPPEHTHAHPTGTGCSTDTNLPAAGPKLFKKARHSCEQENQGPTPHGWLSTLIVRLPMAGKSTRSFSYCGSPSKGWVSYQGMQMPALFYRCYFQGLVSNKVLFGTSNLQRISPEIAIQAHGHLLFHKRIDTSFSCSLKQACLRLRPAQGNRTKTLI